MAKKTSTKDLFSKIINKVNPQALLTKITQDKNNLILVIVLIAIILYLDASFGLKSQMRAIGAVRPRIERLRKDVEEIKSALVEMQTQRPEIEAVKVQVKTLASASQMSWLIEEISHLANQQGVRIFNIKPQWSSSPDISKISKGSSSPKEYSLIVFDLEVSAGYFQLAEFLATLENHSVLFEIKELNIRGNNKDPFAHKITLKLIAYSDS